MNGAVEVDVGDLGPVLAVLCCPIRDWSGQRWGQDGGTEQWTDGTRPVAWTRGFTERCSAWGNGQCHDLDAADRRMRCMVVWWYGVWCVECGVWCVVVWCVCMVMVCVYGYGVCVWCRVYGVWCMMYDCMIVWL